MEQNLFSILCPTCQARLAVNDEALLGHIVSCPKCGSMVLVEPPPEWKKTAAAPATPAQDQHKQPTSPTVEPTKPLSGWSRPAAPPPLPRERLEADAGIALDSASAPGEMVGGLSPTEQQWRKRLAWIIASLAVVLLVAGILLAILPGGSKTAQNAGINQSPTPTGQTPKPTVSPTPPTEKPAANADSSNRSTAAVLDTTWVPDDARLVVSVAPSRLAERSGMD